MLLVFQFPIADARGFQLEGAKRLGKPNWPSPVTDGQRPEFVNYFGRMQERHRGPDDAFVDEGHFCDSRRAIRFDTLAPLACHGIPGIVPSGAFRRLFCDGSLEARGAVARLEVGLTVDSRRLAKRGAINASTVLDIAAGVCALPTTVPPARFSSLAPAARPMVDQGKALAELYADGTTRGGAALSPDSRALVTPGRPQLLVEVPTTTTFESPASFARLDPAKTRGAQVAFGRLRSGRSVIGTWIVQRAMASQVDLRSLRLCLNRLHAEQECLDLTLAHVRQGHIPDGSNLDLVRALNDYFDRATRLINRKAWFGVTASAILDAYDAAEQVTSPADRSSLATQFEGARRQVLRKIQDYEANRNAVRVVSVTVESGGEYVAEKHVVTNVSGQNNIVNVAEYMSNVTNSVTQTLSGSNAAPEVQELIKQLVAQIEAIGTQIEPERTKALADDAETLSKEAARAEPRRKWYEVSLEGLKEAAEAVGELGAPIVATLKKLWPLLLP